MKCLFNFFLIVLFIFPAISFSQVAKVSIIKTSNGFQLTKNGESYYIKGAGAKSNFKKVVESGGNSIRIWSTNKSELLDSAYKYNLSVCLGIWVSQERNGFNYNDEYNVRSQIELIKKEILRLKDHPSVILWGIGNEVDLQYSNFKVWETIEEIAKFIKKVDPNHPTMTVIAGLDPSKVFMIKKHCPSVDILGINVYGAIENAPLNIRRYGWEKPYVITEWGVNGPFEAKTNSWGAKIEPTNGFKANQRLRRYKNIIESDKSLCLGSYCFLWGQKQESTSTWHGMYLSNGHPTEAIDVMQYCWSGNWPKQRAPSIMQIKLNGDNWKKNHIFSTGEEVSLEYVFNRNNNDSLIFDYQLYPETFSNKGGGDFQESPDEIPIEIISKSENKISFKVPSRKGYYRIFVFLKNKYNQSSVANIPFQVEG
ncbi:MAG: hypothetical protein CL821_01440 [Crocinitomicaceae bacterium]|nr:hypothetical protein [Crocinitomicaceae bacterium]